MSADGCTKKQNGGKKRRVCKYVSAPFRGLRWMKDLYVRKMMSCNAGSRNGAIPYSGGGFPRAQSVRSTAEGDLVELVRAASQRDYGGRLNPSKVGMGTPGETTAFVVGTVPRSQTVGMGRIDEDKPMEFDQDVKLGPLYPRSTSAEPMKRQNMISQRG